MLEYIVGSQVNQFYGEYNDKTIKDSRKTRGEKLARKQLFHKKNPKSIAYYAEQQHCSLIPQLLNSIDSSSTVVDNNFTINEKHCINTISEDQSDYHHSINNTDTINNTLNQSIIILKEVNNSMKLNDNTLLYNSDNHKDDQNTEFQYNKNSNNKNFNKKKNIVHKPLSKNHHSLENLSSSLEKVFKKEGVFLHFNSSKGTITTLKDFPAHVMIGKLKASVSLRAVLGDYDIKNIALTHNNHFANIKSDFSTWLNTHINDYDAEKDFYSFYNPILETIHKDQILHTHLPSLESRLINTLRKSSKQHHGFIHKMEQVIFSWGEEAKEVYYIEQVENQLNFKSFEHSFPLARSMKRRFSIYVGKTNSGKTYAAMNTLAQGNTGIYLAPLRLMAHEGQESLSDRNILSNLVTGEEQKKFDGASHVSSTVEMCNMTKPVDVAVIDEIQMISDQSRGWAWSQALVGVPAKHVILVGSEEALPFIIPIIESLGEEYDIERFERKTPLHLHDGLKKFKDLKAGDCVVVFSRKSALEMKNAIEASGKKCSVIYGNLSPDVRRSEANKFKSGENPILVATDAIGMGLNLPISRLFFSTLEKFDGIESRYLHVTEIKQIAGRAGRFGFAQFGEVGLLMNDSYHDKTLLHKAIYGGYEAAIDTRVPIAPNLQQIQTICSTIGKDDLYAALIFFKEKMIKDHKLYKTANLEDMIDIAALLKNKKLDLATGLIYSCVPIDTNSEVHMKHFFKWVNTHISKKEILAPVLPDVIELEKNDSYSLYEAENYVKLCMSYRWLHYKYPDYYQDIETVIDNAKITNDYIEKTLHHHVVMSRSPRWKR